MPDEQLADPKLETRARHLSQELRCLVCQNQDIDSSDAPLARDLRLLVRERLAAGDSDTEARAYIVARYGNFVLLKPPVEGATLALWYGPAAFVLLGGAGAYLMLRRRRTIPDTAPLSPAERARVETLLATDEHGRA
jgi:cytochrome c-type biogenesis protein CcmH